MCRLRNIAICDFQKKCDYRTDGQTDAGQSDPYVPLCFAGDTKSEPSSPTLTLKRSEPSTPTLQKSEPEEK